MGNIGDEVKKIYRSELESSGQKKPAARKKDNFIIMATAVFCAVAIAGAGIYYYNMFATLNQAVLAKQAQLEKEFQRRGDLVPALVSTVKDYSQHERELFNYVSDMRISPESMKVLEGVMKKLQGSKSEKVLSNIIALAEQYPDLKATLNFQGLMDKLEETENRIADMREEYNFAVRMYNTLIVSFPSTLYGYVFGFKEIPYFKAEIELLPEGKTN